MLALTFTHFLGVFAHIITDWGGLVPAFLHAGGLHPMDWGAITLG